jgi:hypothetical protein
MHNKWPQKKKQISKRVKDFPQDRELNPNSRRQRKGLIPWEGYQSGNEPLDLCGILNLKKISIGTYHESLSDD